MKKVIKSKHLLKTLELEFNNLELIKFLQYLGILRMLIH